MRGSIELEWRGEETAVIFLHNPQARNAMSVAMMEKLPSIQEEIVRRDVRTVIITSRDDKAFCAGGDLHDVRTHLLSKEAATKMSRDIRAFFACLQKMSVVIIVALKGSAVGGGAELCTYGHWVFAHKDLAIAFVHNRLGVSPGWGGAMQLIKKIGVHRTRQLLIGAKRLSAEKAKELGLIDFLVAKDQVLQEAEALARDIATRDRKAFFATMNFLEQPSIDAEEEVFLQLWGEEAHQKALGMK